MSMRTTVSDDALSVRISAKDVFKIKLSLSCLSNRVVVCGTTASLYLWRPPSIERPSNQWTLERSGVPVLVISTGDSGARNPKGVHVSLVEQDSGFCDMERDANLEFKLQRTTKELSYVDALKWRRDNEAANVFLKDVETAVQEVLAAASAPELNKLPSSSSRERLKKFRKLKKVEISTPCLFSHVTSITAATQIGEGDKSQNKKDKDKGKAVNGELSRPAHIRRAFSMSKRR
ncbi:hypothetical protein OS493_008093 [Desmophyllum pertusum]|uniref:Uncharacterized protein n=1 Tax=Desmophyllum pertusum TaxID=174260 RepID=A0A9W9YIF8_9CNID|nr:hypothetical protein OS493_008093 [Desmophyllum pertusum]